MQQISHEEEGFELGRELVDKYRGTPKQAAANEMEAALTGGEGITSYALERDGEIAAAISFVDDPTIVGDDIHIEHLGSVADGAGTEALMIPIGAALEEDKGISLVSSKEAERYYEKLGFKREKNTPNFYVEADDFNTKNTIWMNANIIVEMKDIEREKKRGGNLIKPGFVGFDMQAFGGVPRRIVTQEILREQAFTRLSQLKQLLFNRLVQMYLGQIPVDYGQIAPLLRRIGFLRNDSTIASMLLGYASLFKPSIQDRPPGTPRQRPINLALKGIEVDLNPPSPDDEFYFEWTEDAIGWMEKEGILEDHELIANVKRESKELITEPDIKNAVTRSAKEIARGGTLREFRERAKQVVDEATVTTETEMRTSMKGAFVRGQEQLLNKPHISEIFPYIYLSATPDGRVRDTHWDANGIVVRRGTRAHDVLLRLLLDYNCRCTPIPMTQADIDRNGWPVLEYGQLPESVLEDYG